MSDWYSGEFGLKAVTKEYYGDGEPDKYDYFPFPKKEIIILALIVLGFFILREIL